MATKLDMEKAYNMVELNFIQYLLIDLGFSAKWANWISNASKPLISLFLFN